MKFHGLPGTHQCNKCNNSFSDEQALRRHTKLTHGSIATTVVPNRTGSEGSFMCYVCGIIFTDNNSFLTHIETCRGGITPDNSTRATNQLLAPTAPAHTSNTNIGHFVEGNNTQEFFKRVVNQTLWGDYWAQERREVVFNDGRFPARSWEGN